jgi:uncharacterized protein YndB with AHSA1/START domain
MTDSAASGRTEELVLDYELDAPPEKVWRAISNPAFRERWLPKTELAEATPISSTPGKEIRYRMRDDEPPFLESVVTFQVRPNTAGGTKLRIIHGLPDVTLKQRIPRAANSNRCCLMRAA